MQLNLNIQIHTLIWLIPKFRLGNPYLASSCLTVARKAGASKNPITKLELGNEQKLTTYPNKYGDNSVVYTIYLNFFLI